MPISATIALPKTKDLHEFEEMCRDVLNIKYDQYDFQIYGRRGQSQDGIDIISIDKNTRQYGPIVAQCINHLSEKTELIEAIDKDVELIKTRKPSVNHIIIMTEKDRDRHVQDHVSNISDASVKVTIMFWDEISDFILEQKKLMDKHYQVPKYQKIIESLDNITNATVLPKTTDSHEFEEMCRDVLKVKYKQFDFQVYGRPGQVQKGIDIISVDKKTGKYGHIVAICKNYLRESRALLMVIDRDVKNIKAENKDVSHIIIMTSRDRDIKTQDYINEITSEEVIVSILFWEDISKVILENKELISKYYNVLLSDVNTINNLASIYENQNNFEQTESYYKNAIELNEELDTLQKFISKKYGEEYASNDLETVTSYNNLGASYEKQRKYQDAEKYYVKALEIAEKGLGKEHPIVAECYKRLGLLLVILGRYKEAEINLRKSSILCENIYGVTSHETATSYYNLGALNTDCGRYEEAEEYYKKALIIREKIIGKDHPDIAAIYNDLGFLYKKQGKYKEAIEYYNKALEIRLRVFGENHPDLATNYKNLGSLYWNLGKYEVADEYYKMALYIITKLDGKYNLDTNIKYNNLGLLYEKQGKYEKVDHYLEKKDVFLHKEITISPINIAEEDYIRRDKEMDDIKKLLIDSKSKVLLNGSAGIGKTTLATRIYHDIKNDYSIYGWYSFKNSMEDTLLSQTKLSESENELRLSEILNSIQSTAEKKIIFIDDVYKELEGDETFEALLGISNLSILITSELDDIEGFKKYTLQGMNENQCIDLFKMHSEREVKEEIIKEFISCVSSHTSAIILLAKSLPSTKTPEAFLNDIKKAFPKFSTISEFEKELKYLFNINQLNAQEKRALFYFSIIPSINVSYEVLNWFKVDEGIINNLCETGWLNKEGQNLNMNQLLKNIVLLEKVNFPNDFGKEFMESLVNQEIILENDSIEEILPKMEIIESVLENAKSNSLLAKSYRIVAYEYKLINNFEKSRDYYNKSRNVMAELGEDNTLDYAVLCNQLADLYFQSTNLRQSQNLLALKFYEYALETIKSIKGEYSVEYAIICNNIAEVYYAQRDEIQASEYCKKAIDIFVQKFGMEDSKTKRVIKHYLRILLKYDMNENDFV